MNKIIATLILVLCISNSVFADFPRPFSLIEFDSLSEIQNTN